MRAILALKPWKMPFLLALGGVLSDYATTVMGLSTNLGFREVNLQYDPLWALLVFWGAITIWMLTLPTGKLRGLATNGLALVSFLGAVNNALVIGGLSSGLPI